MHKMLGLKSAKIVWNMNLNKQFIDRSPTVLPTFIKAHDSTPNLFSCSLF